MIKDMLHSARILLLMTALTWWGADCAWSQTAPLEGTWFIKSGDYYLCPGFNCHYNDNKEQPHLTTYKTGDAKGSAWRVVKADDDYYYIIHNATGKYLTANDAPTTNAKQLRVHLESTGSPTDNMLFKFEASGTSYGIYPKAYTSENDYYLNVTNGNKDSFAPHGTSVADGMIGFNAKALGSATKWNLVATANTCADPVIVYAGGQFTISYPIASDGATLHYTTDGSEPTSDSPVYTSAIAEDGVQMVRAVAVKPGYANSAVAGFFSPRQGFLFKTQDPLNQSFYMVPPLDETSTTDVAVTLSNVPSARMGWQFMLAERSADVDYYYIVNQVTGLYLYCNGNTNSTSALRTKPLGETGTEPERYKFRLWRTDEYYNIVPQRFANGLAKDMQNSLTKQNATDNINPIGLYTDNGSGHSRWQIIPVPDRPATLSAVSMASGSESTLYWKIQSVADNTFFVYPPAGTDRLATAQKTGTNPEWFLEQATDADPWVTYYHIRNGETGEYLYYKGNAGQEKTFYVTTTENPGSDDSYKFIVVRTANATATNSYNIIPKSLKDQTNQTNNSLNRNNNTLRTQNSRANTNSQWNFVAVADFVSPPDIVYDDTSRQITLTCNTRGATIYYTTDGSDPASSSTRQVYSAAIALTVSSVHTVRACATKGSTTSTVRTKTVNLSTYTQGYYALHLNGTGYLKVNGSDATLSNDGTFRSGNLFGDGNSIWVITPEGFLQNEYYYLNVANNRTLYLSVTPETRWIMEDVAGATHGKKHLYVNDGTRNLYLCNDGGIKVSASTTKYYSACPMDVTELDGGWTGPTTDALTLLSPQQVTYLRHYFTQKISYSFFNDDDASKNPVSSASNDRRIHAILEYSTSSDANIHNTWDVKDNIIYIKDGISGNVTATATYRMLPADLIARSRHAEAVEKDIKFTLQPKAFTPADKDYLLFHINNGNFRFPYDDGIAEGQPVKPYGTKTQLTNSPKNPELSWRLETDEMGFVMFRNVNTGRYLYFDAADYTNSDYGAVKVGATAVPGGTAGTRYKFRLFKLANHSTYGANIVSIIPYDKQFVIFKSDGRTNGILSALAADADNRVITLNKPADYSWKFYPYDVETKYRLKTNFSIGIPADIKVNDQLAAAQETGTYSFTAESYHWLSIKDAPANNQDLEIVNTGTKADIVYTWTLTGLEDYVTPLTYESTGGKSTFAATVNTMPSGAVMGKLQVTAKVTSPETLTATVVTDFNLYPDAVEPTEADFVDIASLDEIDNASGYYRLTTDNPSGTPAVSTFMGYLDGDGHTVDGLSAPLFTTLTGSAVVRNLNLKDVDITAHDGPTGAVAGTATGSVRIYNVGILNGRIGSSNDCCGGIVGQLDGTARVINCFSNADITGGTVVGGIVGNNLFASTSKDLRTMVMNCMFYGDITGSTSKAPVYNGQLITNLSTGNGASNVGLGNYNYFRAEASYVQNRDIQVYNCALMAETRYLQRFEFFRHFLNSNRALAAWYATGSVENKDRMMKWVMEPGQIGGTTPYPVLKTPGYYASVVNIDAEHAVAGADRNKGGKLSELGSNGELKVTVQMGDGKVYSHPGGAAIKPEIVSKGLTLNITDKDFDHFNYNYGKVQLPYYNDVGTGNYTDDRVVTGWKIVSVTGGTTGTLTTTGTDAVVGSDGSVTMPFNYADPQCTAKDLYSDTNRRVFNQGAYWDVPEGVTAITIEPYWGNAKFVSDEYYDVVYNAGTSKQDVTLAGKRFADGKIRIGSKDYTVYTTVANAKAQLGLNSSHTVYDHAVVLVGNVHATAVSSNSTNEPFTIMSADLDGDDEPDNTYVLTFTGRAGIHPVMVDFLNVPGLGMVQKSTTAKGTYNFGIPQPYGWFEVSNTALFRVTQFEYSPTGRSNTNKQPIILNGGVIEQWVCLNSNPGDRVQYFRVGGNVWFKEFHLGIHQDAGNATPHPPVSVTGGDFDVFYLTGAYRADATEYDDCAEAYINGGHFGTAAGTGMEGIGKNDGKGNVTNGNIFWQINNADIDEFYGGGINALRPAVGNIHTVIRNSRVGLFCGGPKFGDMTKQKTVTTTATNCTFGTFFGAGYGGNSYNRYAPKNFTGTSGDFGQWSKWVRGEVVAPSNTYYSGYKQDYYEANGGVSVQIDYQYLPESGNINHVERLFIDYVSFSLATTHNVTSTLTGCTINGNFYGGGSLGKVNGPVTSVLKDCTVHGSTFGAGFSATKPTVQVMNTGGFKKDPFFDQNLGAYLPAEFPDAVTYTWEHADVVNSTETAIDKSRHVLYTIEKFGDLGMVKGNATLTLDGTAVDGSVYGGGDESETQGSTVVTVKGGAQIRGDVFGGGNNGYVGGSTEVNIQD